MTTMAAIFGAMPLAFGRGTGSELRNPLGIDYHWRPDSEPDAHALHHAGRLSLTGPLASEMAARSRKARSAKTNRVLRMTSSYAPRELSDQKTESMPSKESETPMKATNKMRAAAALLCGISPLSRLRCRSEIQSSHGAGAGNVQRGHARRPQEDGRLESRATAGQRSPWQMVGDFRRSAAERARRASQHFQSKRRRGVRQLHGGPCPGARGSRAIFSHR